MLQRLVPGARKARRKPRLVDTHIEDTERGQSFGQSSDLRAALILGQARKGGQTTTHPTDTEGPLG